MIEIAVRLMPSARCHHSSRKLQWLAPCLVALLAFCAWPQIALATVTIGEPLPPVTIDEGGRIILEEDDDYTIEPWSWSGAGNGRVQVLQYVPGTRKGGDLYDPLTDRMQRELDIRRYDIIALVNLDVSSGFIKPFVRSAVVDEQKVFTRATMVLDEEGVGQAVWALTEQAAFVVMDPDGSVVDAILGAPTEDDIERILDVLRDLMPTN